LWDFLEDIFHYKGFRNKYFWADQISMNQQDMEERCHQVRLMSRIYSHAAEVAACVVATTKESNRYYMKYQSVDSQKSHALNVDLINHPYWNRLWIVQELHLASNTTFWCYGHILMIPELKKVVEKVIGSKLMWDQAQLVMSLLNANNNRRSDMSLEEVLERYCRGLCKDPRDKIIGLQALVTAHQRVDADYTKTLAELSKDTFAMMLHASEQPYGDAVEWMLRRAEDWRKIGESIDPNHGNRNVAASCTWAYLIPSMPFLVRTNSWGERSPYAFEKVWDGLLKLALRLAVTPKQIAFTQALRQDRRRFLKSNRAMFAQENLDWHEFTAEVSDLAEHVILRFIEEAGFKMYGDLLCHPDEDPASSSTTKTYMQWVALSTRVRVGRQDYEASVRQRKEDRARWKLEDARRWGFVP
jgi:hypothetical protein